ncbi:MAG: hypothetical protein AAFV07_14490, partial [Bacteroidota bacterium]
NAGYCSRTKAESFCTTRLSELLKSLGESFDPKAYALDLYAFENTLESDMQPDSLSFAGEGTNVGRALTDLRKRYQNQNLGAIVLVSDGIVTSGRNPLYGLEAIQQPVYTVLLGDTTPQRDVRIREVLFNEIAYLKNEMPIRVQVSSDGFDQANVQISLRGQGKTIASKPLRLTQGQPSGEVNFLVEPTETGLQQYEVRVTRLDQEVTYRNNVRRFYVNVLETRVKIALFAGAPHPDLGALKQTFARNEGYEVNEFILRSQGAFYDDPSRYNLEDFDLIILHNYPQSSRDQGMVDKLAQHIEKTKAPAMYFVGTTTDLTVMTPLYPFMSITPKGVNPRSEEVIIDFQPKYRQHSTYTFEDSWISWANASPPIYRNQSNWQGKETAEVFATARIKNIPLDYPVFALQNYLSRKNMVFLGENIWRMRAHSFIEQEDFELFDGWIINNIKWLMVADDKRKFRVTPAKKVFTGREKAVLSAQAYDDSYNPLAGVDIKLRLRGPSGDETDYFFTERGTGQYMLELSNLESGTYSYTAEGRRNDTRVGEDRGQFSVGRSSVEHFSLQADRELLQQIALRTGGEFLYARDLPQLADKLQSLDTLKPEIRYREARTSFFDYPWLLVLLLVFLSVEWIVRKWFSLL